MFWAATATGEPLAVPARPFFSIAATESPPPTTVIAPCAVASASALATAQAPPSASGH